MIPCSSSRKIICFQKVFPLTYTALRWEILSATALTSIAFLNTLISNFILLGKYCSKQAAHMHRDSSADLSLLPLKKPDEYLPPDLNWVAQPVASLSQERNGQLHHFRPFLFCWQLPLPFGNLQINHLFGIYGAGNSNPISSLAAGKPAGTDLPVQYWVEEEVGRKADHWGNMVYFIIVVVVAIMLDQKTTDA